MDIRLSAHHMKLSNEDRTHLLARLEAWESNHHEQIACLGVRLAPQGDREVACRLDATLHTGDAIHVEGEAPDCEYAVHVAADRLSRKLQHELGRRRSIRQRANRRRPDEGHN
jgi:ribosome-associated translation inhibitor RaiA